MPGCKDNCFLPVFKRFGIVQETLGASETNDNDDDRVVLMPKRQKYTKYKVSCASPDDEEGFLAEEDLIGEHKGTNLNPEHWSYESPNKDLQPPTLLSPPPLRPHNELWITDEFVPTFLPRSTSLTELSFYDNLGILVQSLDSLPLLTGDQIYGLIEPKNSTEKPHFHDQRESSLMLTLKPKWRRHGSTLAPMTPPNSERKTLLKDEALPCVPDLPDQSSMQSISNPNAIGCAKVTKCSSSQEKCVKLPSDHRSVHEQSFAASSANVQSARSA